MRVWTKCLTLHIFSQRSLELSQFNVKSLLRRAAAYEALERYRLAYIDYKTALQIDCNIAAAHDGTNRYLSLSGFWSIRRSDPETLTTDISRVSNGGSTQDLTFWLFFVVCQDDEGAHRGRRAVVERKASSDPHRPSFCQRETYSESYRHFSTTEPDTAAERHQTDKQTWWEELWFLLHSVLELMLREVMSFSSLYVFR